MAAVYISASSRLIRPDALRICATLKSSRRSPSVAIVNGYRQLNALNAAVPAASRALQTPFITSRGFQTSSIAYQQKDSAADGKQESQQQQQHSESEPDNGENKKEDGKKGEEENAKKEAPPPPPPHGDKTPWQVFRDTFRSELQASKEWNESTKALASSAHDLAESERIRKARAAYEAASSAASTKTSAALKKTGSAIGKGAAWTWETPVVKGIRTGVSATGRGLDMATKPVRETEAYKKTVSNVKEVMDDGASTRYGGWIEKEERRKQRALREAKEGRSKVEVIQEDPK